MQIQYASDLHLEFPKNKKFLIENPIQPLGEILILAGDIVLFTELNKHLDFFKRLSDNFEFVYWLPGNHEYYFSEITAKSGILYEPILSNVFIVNEKVIVHQNIKLVFSTLWSKINPAHQWEIERRINDFRVIKYNGFRFSVDWYNKLHDQCLQFIKGALTELNESSTVVVSHHVPTLLNYPEKYQGDILNEAFAVELFDLIESKGPDYWIYGHHHFNCNDFSVGNTRLITNQLGYIEYGENIGFEGNVCINL